MRLTNTCILSMMIMLEFVSKVLDTPPESSEKLTQSLQQLFR